MEMQNQSINIFHPVTSNGLDYIMLCAIEYKHVYRRYAVTLDGGGMLRWTKSLKKVLKK